MARLNFRNTQNKPDLSAYLMKKKSDNAVRTRLKKSHPYDIGEALIQLDSDVQKRVLTLISAEKLSRVFEVMEKEHVAERLDYVSEKKLSKVLNIMELDEIAELFTYLDEQVMTHTLSLLSKDNRKALNRILKYNILSVGGQMNNDFIRLKPDMDVKDAMRELITHAEDTEVIDTLLVVNEDKEPVGLVDLKTLIVARHPKTIKDIMYTNYYSAHVDDLMQDVVSEIKRYDAPLTPVINDEGRLEGVVTLDDVMDAIEEESHDDYAKLAGINTEDQVYDTPFKKARGRFPWLALMLGLNLIVTSVLSGFEDTIAAVTALVLFQPLILGMAGNIGTQSLAVTILKLSEESSTKFKNTMKHISREVSIGLINGFLLGVLGFLMATLFLSIAPMGVVSEGTIRASQIGMVVGLAIFSALTVSTFLGSMIPMILSKLRVDPAIASGPFITTLNDISALIVYFTLASVLIITLL
ncbi:MAG: magnesium transporter [Bacillota bacterium]